MLRTLRMTGARGVGWYRDQADHVPGGSAPAHARRPSARHGVAWTHTHRSRPRARRCRTRRAHRRRASGSRWSPRCSSRPATSSGPSSVSPRAGSSTCSTARSPRTSGRASPRGAFFDSVADRVSDAVVFGGVAWYLGRTSGRAPVLALAAVALAMLISYERAKAEGLGYDARGGIMERAERMVLLGIGMAFDILVPVLWIMVVLMAVTAVHRFVKVWRQASDLPARPELPAGPAPAARRRATASPRRSGGAARSGPPTVAPCAPRAAAAPERRRTDAVTVVRRVPRCGAAVANAVPQVGGARRSPRSTGRLLAPVLVGRRRIVRRNLQRATDGALEGLALERAVSDTFASYGRYWLELFRLPADARGIGGGSCHVGRVRAHHHRAGGGQRRDPRVAAPRRVRLRRRVARRSRACRRRSWWRRSSRPRSSSGSPTSGAPIGMEVIPLGPDAAAGVLRALRENRVVCLLSDRDIAGDGTEVEFFGETTTLPAGPADARPAHRRRADPDRGLLPAPRRSTSCGSCRRCRSNGRAACARMSRRVTQDLARRFEELVRMAPEQWHVMQPNWPSDRGDVAADATEHPTSRRSPTRRRRRCPDARRVAARRTRCRCPAGCRARCSGSHVRCAASASTRG